MTPVGRAASLAVRRRSWAVLAAVTLVAVGGVQAEGRGEDGAPAEEVVFVRYPQFLVDIQLETTVYKPGGRPPWPLVVVNHGSRGYDNPHRQDRNRPVETARFFLERGYLVVAPMRQGFSQSTGVYTPSNCDPGRYAERYGGDIAAVIDHFVKQGLARPDEVLVTGQSNGGMVTLGYAANQPKARAIINFAGGINTTQPGCDWAAAMVRAAKSLGARTAIPSLWIYAEDDSIFPPAVSRPFFDAYRAAGARASLRLFPSGGHGFSTTRTGRQTWGPDVEQFLRDVGLPATPVDALRNGG
ncbi:MAG: prolyl oligopeptidase family serine peptidase [Rubrivivax sp.]